MAQKSGGQGRAPRSGSQGLKPSGGSGDPLEAAGGLFQAYLGKVEREGGREGGRARTGQVSAKGPFLRGTWLGAAIPAAGKPTFHSLPSASWRPSTASEEVEAQGQLGAPSTQLPAGDGKAGLDGLQVRPSPSPDLDCPGLVLTFT